MGSHLASRSVGSRLRQSHLSSIWAVPVIVLLLVGGSLTWFSYDEYRSTLEREFRYLESNARIADAQMSGLVRNINQLLSGIAEERKQLSPDEFVGFDALLAERRRKFPELRSLVVVNAQGRVELTGNPNLKGFDSSKRDYFVAHLGQPMMPNFYASRPFRTSFGDIGIAFSVAIYDSDRRFQGTVVSGINPKYFDDVLNQVRPSSEDGLAALINQQGEILNRLPDPETNIGRNVAGAAPFQEHRNANRRMTRTLGDSPGDGARRIYVLSRVGDTSLVVALSRSVDAVLAPWRTNLVLRGLTFLITAAITLSLAWIARRRQQEVLAGKAFTEKLIESANVMVVGLDHRGRVTQFNQAAEEISGYSRHEVLGKDWFELVVPKTRYPEVWDTFEAVLSSGNLPRTFENPILTKSGHERLIAWQNSAIHEHDQLMASISFGIDVTERRQAEKQVSFLAYHDPLTQLPNRQLVQDRFRQAVAATGRTQRKMALLFIDLDNFKTINDTLGHAIGDELLKEVATRLKTCVRLSDTISRQGGDEFLVILPDLSDADTVAPIVLKLMQCLAPPFYIDGHELTTSASVGVALYPDDGIDFDTLTKKADMAMYRAKEAGRNTYRFFDEQMNADAIEQLNMRNGLSLALARDEFVLHYQPKIDMRSGTVIGVEALLRWQHPELGMVPPGRFIPVAEDSRLIVPIGEWVLREACRQAMVWRKAGLPEMSVAVNLSAVQFKQGDVEQTVIGALEESGLSPELLELELTESILIQNVDSVLATVKRIKQMGVTLSIDDFGTGYSSLSYLTRFEIDRLKIDQSFVRNLASNANDAAIVRAIIQIGRSLNFRTIAEGVEDGEMLEQLRQLGCDEAQGFYFARPMPAGMLAGYLSQRAS